MRGPRTAVLTAIVVIVQALTVAACARTTPSAEQPATVVSDFAPGQTPRLRSRDLTLPAGCSVEDHTPSLALYSRTTGAQYPAETLGVVDLASGRRSEVVTAPVSSGALNVLGSALSDTWVAWEEVWEAEEHWRLLAAPLDGDRLELGSPIVIDEADSAQRYRPLFALQADTLTWATQDAAGEQPGATLRSAELPTGERRDLLAETGIMTSMRVQDGTAVMTVRPETGSDDVVIAVDSRSGGAPRRRHLGNTGATSHWVDWSGDTLAWAVFPDADAWMPDAFLTRGTAPTMTLHTEACDPTIRGALVFFETAPTRLGGTPTGLEGVDLDAGTRFELVEPSPPDTPFWQLVTPVVDPGGLLLAWRDETAYPPSDREPVCTLRIWETGRASSRSVQPRGGRPPRRDAPNSAETTIHPSVSPMRAASHSANATPRTNTLPRCATKPS